MGVVLKIVNYICSSAKTHQLKNFLKDIEDNIPNDVLYCLVRWILILVNNMLSKFFQLLELIKVFLIIKN